ncbi:PucR family transcriptional regulator [Desulfosporosinus meridiei]|uniref:Sugar diacid utilization regulator n=1 Tax=Desulfosporosinus meridiei (strain ATCC BAA-275 / DSM 13257 / KCTC 12902 / NCIMB 13706 / S10) TaxID=768704 RepID=J7IWM5_DESMD|nr:helix-turn-helix domain-containing protein [Desulfosporosinus meridiei]AFQ46232.1 sugar diacid utilization regulator [Desulfosporosinus meridiei DSM 13257]
MSKQQLPYAITLNRFLEFVDLYPADPNESAVKECEQWSVQKFEFKDHGHITLPWIGHFVSLQPEDGNIKLSIIKKGCDPSKDPNNGIVLQCAFNKQMSWEAFCERAVSWIEREQGRILAVSEQYFQELAKQLAHGRSFAILHNLREILGFDLFVLNKQLEILEWAGGNELPENPLPFISPKRSLPNLCDPAEELFSGKWAEPFNVPLTWYPLLGGQGILGYLGMATSLNSLGSIERLFLDKTATLLLLELAKAQCVQENERHYHRDFLFDLLYNNFDSLEVIISRGKLWGWDFSKPHLVVVGEIPGFDPDSPQQEIFEDIMSEIMSVLRSYRPKTICLERNGQIVMLFPQADMIPANLWIEQAQTLLRPVLKLLAAYPKEHQLSWGMGNLYPTARSIHRSFQEARSALELGQLFDLNEPLIAFQDLGVMRLLYRLDRQELEDFRNEILGPLLKFDRENNLALEETLLVYLTSSTDLNAAGEKLFLHPNTLRYRLKKATEILGRDLSVLENQMNLFIALKIGKLKTLWPE